MRPRRPEVLAKVEVLNAQAAKDASLPTVVNNFVQRGGPMVAAPSLLDFATKRREGGFVVGHSGLEPEANGLRIRCSTN